MACCKGYRGECCCECEYQLKIHICDCGRCSDVEGYICIISHIIDKDYACYYRNNKHGCCEMFIKKHPNKK